MQEDLNQFQINDVWDLVAKPPIKRISLEQSGSSETNLMSKARLLEIRPDL